MCSVLVFTTNVPDILESKTWKAPCLLALELLIFLNSFVWFPLVEHFSACRAWQWFSEHDWWVRANSVFLVLRTFPSVCGIQVLPGGEGKKIPFLLVCVAILLHHSVCLQLSHFFIAVLSTSVFVLTEQMKTLIEAGSGGGCCRRCEWPTEDVNQPELLLRLLGHSVSCGWAKIRWWWAVTHLGRGRRQMGNFLCIIPGE